MKGDFTRSTFRPDKHYSGVRMQQGRVQLDADWNENLDILLHRIETETLDVVGTCGVPVHNAAFGVVTDFSALSQEEQDLLTELGFNSLDPGDFYLTRGRAYVDGILVENDLTLPFSQQPFVLPKGEGQIADPGIYLLYLDVWQRHITALEDPHIREVALGGPDTATRTQVIWQARLANVGNVGDTVTCADDLHPWPDASTGRLRARTTPEDVPEDPCTVPPAAGYKRLENQLYRVEIHKGSDDSDGPTFKWSRDNGSVAVAIAEFNVDGVGTKIRTTSLGRDDVLGLHENDWIEIIDDATELSGQHGQLVQISEIDPDNILSLSDSVSGDLDGHPKARRWDANETQTTQGDIVLTEGSYIALEGGVEIQFETGGTYRTGDYWLIPARTVPGQYGDIEWPKDESDDPAALLAFGIAHHYCKLAVITADLVEDAISMTDVEDCRKKFPPLTELPTGGNCCCSVSVGDGGNYPDIQSALAARPDNTGEWRICVTAGEYHLSETVVVDSADGLVISGCSRQTHIIGPADQPAFSFSNSLNVQLDNLWVDASSPLAAILFEGCRSINVDNCLIVNQIQIASDTGESPEPKMLLNRTLGRFGKPGPGIVVKLGRQVEIRDNDILGLPAILAGGADISLTRNHTMGGGIQIVAPSAFVEIDDNVITKGFGPGIQLGGGEDDFSGYTEVFGTVDAAPNADAMVWTAKTDTIGIRAKNPLAGIRTVGISRNLIGRMRGSGIVTELNLQAAASLSEVEALSISDNQIIDCCSIPDIILSDTTRVGGGIALIGAYSTQISDNFIALNGSASVPACGIFLLTGSDIDIDGNIIIENGTDTDSDTPDSYQAGIAAQAVFGNFLGIGQNSAGKLGYPALRIHGNQVICPAGQALSVAAAGSVVVDGNTLATRERLKQPAEPLHFGEKGACVAILDMGLPIWLPDFAVLLQMMASGQTNLHIENFERVDELFERFPDGRVLFNNNQVTFHTDQQETIDSLGDRGTRWTTGVWDTLFFSVLLVSLDDISIVGNQFQATVPPYAGQGLNQYQQLSLTDLLVYLLKFIHVGSAASSVRATGNNLEERLFSNWISYASIAMAMNATTGNEATHIFSTSAPKKAEANNLSLTS